MAFATIRSTAAPNVISSRAILNFELTPGSTCKLLRAIVQSAHSLSGLSVSWAEQMANSADQTAGMLTCSRAYSSHDSGWFGFDSQNNTPLVQLGSSEMACQVSGHSWKTQHYVNDTNRVNVNASVHGFDKKASMHGNVLVRNVVKGTVSDCSGCHVRYIHTQISHSRLQKRRLGPLPANLYGLATE